MTVRLIFALLLQRLECIRGVSDIKLEILTEKVLQ